MSLSSQHHSFDIGLAAKYGIERAILIQHFQHWIRFNRIRKTNLKENKCWTYQTRAEIAAHFPYMSQESIRHHLDVLIHGSESLGIEPVLIAKNLSKNRMNKTLWYAFIDEEKFGVSEDQIQKMFTKGENPTSKGENPTSSGENPTCNKDKILKEDAERKNQKAEARNHPPPSSKAKKEKPSQAKAGPSAIASDLADFYFMQIREKKPDFKKPNLENWAKEIDLMIRIDKRDPEKIKALILALKESPAGFAYIQSAKKLREKFDEQEMRLEHSSSAKRIKTNRLIAIHYAENYKSQYRGLTYDNNSVINTVTGKGIYLDMPEEEFKYELKRLFGVYV